MEKCSCTAHGGPINMCSPIMGVEGREAFIKALVSVFPSLAGSLFANVAYWFQFGEPWLSLQLESHTPPFFFPPSTGPYGLPPKKDPPAGRTTNRNPGKQETKWR